MATKHFFQSELRPAFITIIPRIRVEHLLGTSFTSQDQLRTHSYALLADILHHARNSLPYELFGGVFQLCVRQLHDTTLQSYVQIMYGRLMMNFAEPLVQYQK